MLSVPEQMNLLLLSREQDSSVGSRELELGQLLVRCAPQLCAQEHCLHSGKHLAPHCLVPKSSPNPPDGFDCQDASRSHGHCILSFHWELGNKKHLSFVILGFFFSFLCNLLFVHGGLVFEGQRST